MEESVTVDDEYEDHLGFASVNEDEQAVLYMCGEENETLVEGHKMFQSLQITDEEGTCLFKKQKWGIPIWGIYAPGGTML